MIRVKIESGIYKGMILDVDCDEYEDLSTENVFLCTVVESDNANQLAVGLLIYSNDRGLLYEHATNIDYDMQKISKFVETQINPYLTKDPDIAYTNEKLNTPWGIVSQIKKYSQKSTKFPITYFDSYGKLNKVDIDMKLFEQTSDVVSNNIDEFIDKQIKPNLTDDKQLISYSYVMTTAKGIKEQIECMLPKIKLFQIMYIDKNEKLIRYSIDASIFE